MDITAESTIQDIKTIFKNIGEVCMCECDQKRNLFGEVKLITFKINGVVISKNIAWVKKTIDHCEYWGLDKRTWYAWVFTEIYGIIKKDMRFISEGRELPTNTGLRFGFEKIWINEDFYEIEKHIKETENASQLSLTF